MSGIPFGKYQLVKRLARGGMAEVFLARQSGPEGFQRMVAVKRILPHLVDFEDFVRMFQDEARLAAQLTHPNVVHIYDFGKVDEHFFIAMEYVDGVHAGVLIAHAQSERLPDVLVARIGADACAGLHYAHELREAEGRALHIVHRDVSPPNLLVSYDGSVKLVDFGIAKAVSSIEQTRPGVVKGKFAYMSPEQTIGQRLDGRSDVFSLAVLLWELLAGRVMVPRLDPIDGMRMIRDGRVPPIEQERPDIAPALGAAIGRALQTRREDRSTALELGRSLEEFIKDSPDGIGSALELAEWVRERFPRENMSGNHPALGEAPPGTRPSTRATHAALPSRDGMDLPSPMMASMAALRTGAHAALGARAATEKMTTTSFPELAPMAVGDLDFGEDDASGIGDEPPNHLESSSVIVAAGWMLEDQSERTFDTDEHARDTVEAETHDFHRAHMGTDTHIRMLGPDPFDSHPPRRRRASSQAGQRAGRIAVVIAAGAAIAVVSTLALKQFGSPEPEPDAEPAPSPGPTEVTLPASDPPPIATPIATPLPTATPIPTATAAPIPEATAGAGQEAAPGTAADPATAAGAPAPRAVIEVVTAPRGARVALGDLAPARSPARFDDLAPGEYRLRVSRRGFQPLERTVEVSSGEHRSIELELVPDRGAARAQDRRRAEAERRAAQPPASGVLKVRTRPYSEVYLDGRRLGQTPLVTELRPGRYTLDFKHPGKPSQRRDVTVRAGAETKLDFELGGAAGP